MMRIALIILAVVIATPANADAIPETDETDTCNASGLFGLVGQTGEIARLLERDAPIRVIAPNSPVTQDFQLGRINFNLDKHDIITGIWCG